MIVRIVEIQSQLRSILLYCT